jgi:HSP20 family protein
MATLVRWEPLREAAAMHTELSRLMNGLFEGSADRPTQAWVPTLDVWETDAEVVYAFDLPGISKDKIAIEAEDGALTVSATRERDEKVENDRYVRFERRYGTFSRTVGLPHGVSEDAIKASYDQGVLEIRVPKPEQPKPKRIEIAGGDASQPQTIEGNATQS